MAPIFALLLGSLTGQVVLPSADVQLELRDRNSGELRASAKTGPEGRFAFEGLPVGEYRLTAMKDYHETLNIIVRVRQEGQEITLHRIVLPLVTHFNYGHPPAEPARSRQDYLSTAPPLPPTRRPLCEVLQHPTWFNLELVIVRGQVVHDEDLFAVKASACPNTAIDELWLEYQGTRSALAGATATLTGRVDALAPEACRKGGYGPFGQYCARLVVQTVSDISR